MLDALSDLMNRVERGLHRELCSGRKWTGDLAVWFYKSFGISAKLMESAYAARQAKVAAAAELAKLHVAELSQKLEAKRRHIKAKSDRLGKARKSIERATADFGKAEAKVVSLVKLLDAASVSGRPLAMQQYKSMLGVARNEREALGLLVEKTRRLKADLHQHKRCLTVLQHRLRRAKATVESPSVAFGTKGLFRAQFHLAENGFASHADWREAWRRARNASFMIEGAASKSAGNQFARLSPNEDGLFDLELRLPEALKHLADESVRVSNAVVHVVRIEGLHFAHRADELREALGRNTAVAVRFHRDGDGWRIMPSFKTVDADAAEDYRCGAVGVDLNAGHVSVTRVDRFGNPVDQFDVPLVTYGKSAGQARDACRQVAARIADFAALRDLPIVAEKLDFYDKKKRLREAGTTEARRARQLSSFAYSAFAAALESACARRGVHLRRVNSAYTSIIGRTKTARRYGSSVHAAASLAIARRAMGLSEELPRSSIDTRILQVPMDDAHLVALELPARKDPGGQDAGSRHVWSDWNRVAKSFREALAARRPSGRKRPPRSTLGRGEVRSMVGRSGRTGSGSSLQSRNRRVGSDAASV